MLSCIIINAIVTWILLLQRFHLFLFYKEIESTFEMSINVIIFWLTIITRFIVIFHSWKCTFDATLALFYFVSSMHSKVIKSRRNVTENSLWFDHMLSFNSNFKINNKEGPNDFSSQPVTFAILRVAATWICQFSNNYFLYCISCNNKVALDGMLFVRFQIYYSSRYI